jgi:hypothetical protein
LGRRPAGAVEAMPFLSKALKTPAPRALGARGRERQRAAERMAECFHSGKLTFLPVPGKNFFATFFATLFLSLNLPISGSPDYAKSTCLQGFSGRKGRRRRGHHASAEGWRDRPSEKAETGRPDAPLVGDLPGFQTGPGVLAAASRSAGRAWRRGSHFSFLTV